jgi:hypothetical protein
MKGYNDPSILCAVFLFVAVLVSPAFADMKKVEKKELAQTNASVKSASVKKKIVNTGNMDDEELARTNISVTGTSIKDRINCVEKDGICQGTTQDRVTSNTVPNVSSLKVSTTIEGVMDSSYTAINNVINKDMFQFGMSGSHLYDRVGTVTAAPLR